MIQLLVFRVLREESCLGLTPNAQSGDGEYGPLMHACMYIVLSSGIVTHVVWLPLLCTYLLQPLYFAPVFLFPTPYPILIIYHRLLWIESPLVQCVPSSDYEQNSHLPKRR